MAVDLDVRLAGLEDIERALEQAFPRDPRKQKQVLGGGMRRAAQPMLTDAKLGALRGDSSGALSDSLGIRSVSKRDQNKYIKTGQGFSVSGIGGTAITQALQIVSLRNKKSAIAKYQSYYDAPWVESIRHAHLVEFGHGVRGNSGGRVGPRPFLGPAVDRNARLYVNLLAASVRKSIELAVARAAKKRAKR